MIIGTLNKAMQNKNPGKNLIFHSDRGSQYASHEFRKWLRHYGFHAKHEC